MSKRKYLIVVATAAIAMLLLLSGCANNESAFTVTNSTDCTLAEVSIREVGTKKFGDNLIAESPVEADGSFELRYSDAKRDEVETNYDIKIKFDGIKKAVILHDVPVVDMNEAVLKTNLDENKEPVAFIEYTSVETKEEISTADSENEIRNKAIKKAKEEAERKAREEA